ncbi:ras-like protein family member 12 [Lineus longissimus]|uniref:ras-like protein family member 12 n=1 Tax=Lineus longissimus TaxID=88925 RepID=UPI002B4EFA67
MSGIRKISPRSQRNSSPIHCNMVLLGALGVGKSALTVKYMTKRFIMEYDPYLEDTYSKPDVVDGQDVTINVMDTYDRDRQDLEKYYKWADLALIVYSITSRPSFRQVREYIYSIAQYQKTTGKDIPIVLVGNKVDLERYRQVSKSEGSRLATENDCLFYETTAAEEFEHVQSIFHDAVRMLIGQGREPTMDLLYINEENGRGGFSGNPYSRQKQASSFRRAKSPRGFENGKDKKGTTSFKFFNKSFKIFN